MDFIIQLKGFYETIDKDIAESIGDIKVARQIAEQCWKAM